MFNKLFSKSKLLTTQPHPLKLNFATQVIPSSFTGNKASFLNAMLSEESDEFLATLWNNVGEKVLGKKNLIPPDGLSVRPFQENDYFFILFTFPTPTIDGEPYFSLIVLDPPMSGEWNENTVTLTPYQYYISTAQGEKTEIHLLEDELISQGTGPEPVDHLFIEWVMNRVFTGSPVISIKSGDNEMAEAIQAAQHSLPAMLALYAQGTLPDFTVKVQVFDEEDPDNSEHFWLSQMEIREDHVAGIIDAAPRVVSNVVEGQKYQLPLENITDWMYVEDEMIHGNYTLRVLLPQMPEQEAEMYASKLAPLPEVQ